MNWLDMPPLSALRAFAAFAESGNVVQAGEALNVTHAAISQQLRALEAHLQVALVDRSGRSLTLTAAGGQLAQALALGFGAINAAVQEISGAGAGAARPLHVSTTPGFAATWLMPRLPEFHAAHPDVDLMIDPSPKLIELKPGGIDMALRYGRGNWPGLEAELLVETTIAVVAAPSLMARYPPVTGPADLANLPWLEELGTTEADGWLRRQGVNRKIVGQRIHVPGNLMLDGLRDGLGVAAVTRLAVEADVAAGRLRVLFDEAQAGEGYHIVTLPGVQRGPVRQFASWLRRAAKGQDQKIRI